jgi:uncharacterized membrane protein YcaP (DUF421 family)
MDTGITVFDWERMFMGEHPELYFLEIAFKALVVFLVLLIVLRMMGKRSQQNISPMQHLLLIALGSAAGDAILYPEVSLGYAALILVGMTLLAIGLEVLNERSRPVRDYVEARPRLLVHDGRVDEEALKKERTTERELYAAMRVRGARSLRQVDYAILEVTGEISVFLNDRLPERDDLVQYIVDEDWSEAPKPHTSE